MIINLYLLNVMPTANLSLININNERLLIRLYGGIIHSLFSQVKLYRNKDFLKFFSRNGIKNGSLTHQPDDQHSDSGRTLCALGLCDFHAYSSKEGTKQRMCIQL
jgi:hypothetical protein